MKYKLINKQTGEEHLCDKVTIDGFDYYVRSEDKKVNDFIHLDNTIKELPEYNGNHIIQLLDETLLDSANTLNCKKVIATNNPNIDIPKIISKIDLTKLCYYDRRNPDFSIKEEYGYDKEEVEATGNFAKKDCSCDNCFYGRSALTEQLVKSQETHSNSDEDMIEFAEWKGKEKFEWNIKYNNWTSQLIQYSGCVYTTKELLKLWKEQQPKIVYYE